MKDLKQIFMTTLVLFSLIFLIGTGCSKSDNSAAQVAVLQAQLAEKQALASCLQVATDDAGRSACTTGLTPPSTTTATTTATATVLSVGTVTTLATSTTTVTPTH
jgi:hypothetical protein